MCLVTLVKKKWIYEKESIIALAWFSGFEVNEIEEGQSVKVC